MINIFNFEGDNAELAEMFATLATNPKNHAKERMRGNNNTILPRMCFVLPILVILVILYLNLLFIYALSQEIIPVKRDENFVGLALIKGWPAGFEPTQGDPQSPMLAKLHHGHHYY